MTDKPPRVYEIILVREDGEEIALLVEDLDSVEVQIKTEVSEDCDLFNALKNVTIKARLEKGWPLPIEKRKTKGEK